MWLCFTSHPCFQAYMNGLPIYCDRDGFIVTEVHTFLSKHVPKDGEPDVTLEIYKYLSMYIVLLL